MTLVSVVIPVFNGERFLDATLASVFAQDYRPIEVIVVDDGSTDGTRAVLERWPEVIAIHQENAGCGAARNAGIARARGELIALQDADDLWVPDKLTRQIAHLEAHPEHGIVAALVQSFLEPGCERPTWLTERQLAEPRPGGIGNLVIRREVMARLGPLDAAIDTDADLSIRAHELGIGVGFVDAVLLHRRVHANNLSNRIDGQRIHLRALRAAIARRRAARTEER